jgi:hypothetical protein
METGADYISAQALPCGAGGAAGFPQEKTVVAFARDENTRAELESIDRHGTVCFTWNSVTDPRAAILCRAGHKPPQSAQAGQRAGYRLGIAMIGLPAKTRRGGVGRDHHRDQRLHWLWRQPNIQLLQSILITRQRVYRAWHRAQ